MPDHKPLFVKGKGAVISQLGYWPEFCDARIIGLEFHSDAGSDVRLSLSLRYIDTDLGRDLTVKLDVYGISDMSLSEFRMENIIDRITIRESFGLEIEAASGLHGCCRCTGVDVELVAATPYPA